MHHQHRILDRKTISRRWTGGKAVTRGGAGHITRGRGSPVTSLQNIFAFQDALEKFQNDKVYEKNQTIDES